MAKSKSKPKKSRSAPPAAPVRYDSLFRQLSTMWASRLALAYARPSRDLLKLACGVMDSAHEQVEDSLDLLLELPFDGDEPEDMRSRLAAGLRELERKGPNNPLVQLRRTPLWRNLQALARYLHFSEIELAMLLFAMVSSSTYSFKWFLDHQLVQHVPQQAHFYLATMLGLPVAEVRTALRSDSALLRSGLVRSELGDGMDELLLMPDRLIERLLEEHDDPLPSVMAVFARELPAPQLTVEDFPHLRDEIDRLSQLLTSVRQREVPVRGLNILLHGAPGVGKTELARLLLHTAGWQALQVEFQDERGEHISSAARLDSCVASQALLAESRQSALVFDEIEDIFQVNNLLSLFGIEETPQFGKAYLNALLEHNPVPMIWIANRVDHIDPAVLRRFLYVLELPAPPAAVRQRMVETMCQDRPVSAELKQQLARTEQLNPALLKNSLRLLELMPALDPTQAYALVRDTLERSCRLLDLPTLARSPIGIEFDPAYVRSEPAVHTFLASLPPQLQGSLCFYGPPGTGKSLLARQIAERQGRPLLLKRSSDLLSKWVGDNEQNIAAMFREAEQSGAVLLLDEADSLLQDRQQASQRWEVSMANELLSQMETFTGLFICTTNLIEQIDPATLRRFDLKLRFDWLSREQAWALFQATCAQRGLEADSVSHSQLAAIDYLTPADFAVASKRLRLTGTAPSPAALLTALRAEVALKPAMRGSRQIGFAG